MSKDTGGQAFPAGLTIQKDLENIVVNSQHQGMALRDWFAGQALAGMLSRKGSEKMDTFMGIAEIAFEYADAMIKERTTP